MTLSKLIQCIVVLSVLTTVTSNVNGQSETFNIVATTKQSSWVNGLNKIHETPSANLYALIKNGKVKSWIVKDTKGNILDSWFVQEKKQFNNKGKNTTQANTNQGGAVLKCRVCAEVIVDGRSTGQTCWEIDCKDLHL